MSDDNDIDIEIKNGDIEALPIKREITLEQSPGQTIRIGPPSPCSTLIEFPKCENPSCTTSDMVPKLRQAEDDWFELGYLCTVCHRFVPCISVYQWLFRAVTYQTDMIKEALPKEAKTLEEATELLGETKCRWCGARFGQHLSSCPTTHLGEKDGE